MHDALKVSLTKKKADLKKTVHLCIILPFFLYFLLGLDLYTDGSDLDSGIETQKREQDLIVHVVELLWHLHKRDLHPHIF